MAQYFPCFVLLDSFISVAEYRTRPLTERCHQQQPITKICNGIKTVDLKVKKTL